MSEYYRVSRRFFLAMAGAARVAMAASGDSRVPVGLELYSVRQALKEDLTGTVAGVAKMGYQCVEFYAPYYQWTTDFAKQVRAQLDDLGVKCYSTHNDASAFSPDGLGKAVELNKILGARYVVMAHPGAVKDIDVWKRVADKLNQANDKLKLEGMHSGYHNHDLEWRPMEGQKPLEVIAANTDKSVMLQLDVGTCLATGNDPVAWINKNPGRIRSVHCKDWSPEQKYRALFGEGAAPWKQIFQAAESTGGVEYYLIEQEGSDHPEMETAELCLANWRKLRK